MLCSDPSQHERDPAHVDHERALGRRFNRLAHRRCRRIVRRVFGVERGLRRLRGRWHVPGHGVGRALCALTACRYHLADIAGHYGHKRVLQAGCALVVAQRYGVASPELGDLLGMSGSAVRAIEAAALPRLAHGLGVRMPKQGGPRASVRDRVLEALRQGDATVPEIVRRARSNDAAVRAELVALRDAGVIAMRARSLHERCAWYLVAANAVTG